MIRYQAAVKKFGEFVALDHLDLDVVPGEVMALIGPNGSGKTTALKLAAGLLKPASGQVTLKNIPAWQAPTPLKSELAYLPQRISFPESLNAVEILTLYAELRGIGLSKVGEALDLLSLSEHQQKPVREFSGGMIQRLGLATVFLAPVRCMILDEPTLNLDPPGVRLFRNLLDEVQARGTTVLFTSHILPEIERMTDRVGIMAQGKLVSLKDSSDFYELILSRSIITIGLGDQRADLLDVALKAGATSAFYQNSHMEIAAPPHEHYRVISALGNAGAEMGEIATIKPTLEQLIMELFGEAS